MHAGSLAESKITPFSFRCTSVNRMLDVVPLEVEQKQLNNPTMPLSAANYCCADLQLLVMMQSDDEGPAMHTQPEPIVNVISISLQRSSVMQVMILED